MRIQPPLFVDIEASSLSLTESYPIQVSFNCVNNLLHTYFINPENVRQWVDWNPGAEKVHQFSHDYIIQHGRSPYEVASNMNQLLKDRQVFCNGLENDKFWLKRLFVAANLTPSFEIKDFFDLIPKAYFEKPSNKSSPLYSAMAKIARGAVEGRAHDATNDVQYLINLYRLVENVNAIKNQGVSIFQDENIFFIWLQTSLTALSNDSPVSRLSTDEGTQQVMDLLDRIRLGEFR